MKVYRDTWFEVKEARQQFGLADIYRSKDAAIIAMNDAQLRQKEQGYKPADFRVFEVNFMRIFDDNGHEFEQTTKTCVYK